MTIGTKISETGEDIAGFEPGWVIWPIIPYSYNTIVDVPGVAPAPPSADNWLGTDGRFRLDAGYLKPEKNTVDLWLSSAPAAWRMARPPAGLPL